MFSVPPSKEAPAHENLDPSKDTSDPTPFQIKALHLASLVDPKNLKELEKMGGADGLIAALGSDATKGLQFDDGAVKEKAGEREVGGDVQHEMGVVRSVKATIEDRQRVYGCNAVPSRKSKSLLMLMWLAFKDKILVSSLLPNPRIHTSCWS